MSRALGPRRPLPVAVRERPDLDLLARRLLALVARLRAAAPVDALARAEFEFLSSALEATVKGTLLLGVDAKVLLYQVRRLLYTSQGAVETRIRMQPRAVVTHVAFRRAVERELRDVPLR